MSRKFSIVCAGWAAVFGGSVVAALFPVAAQQAAAQETNPMPALRDYGMPTSAPSDSSQVSPQSEPATTTPPSYCRPCLYYNGDFDAGGPHPNGLGNGNTEGGDLVQIFSPFTVPLGKKWIVTGFVINAMDVAGVQDPPTTGWSIWTGVGSGVAGTLIAAGAGKGKLTPTGRSLEGVNEYTTSVKASVTLRCGVYWLNVLPQCTDTGDTNCTTQIYFESDVEDASPAHHHGPANILDESFLSSNFFGVDYVSTVTECGGASCDLFSFGVIGTATAGPSSGCL